MPNFTRLDDDRFAFDLFGSRVVLSHDNKITTLTGPDLPSPIELDAQEVNAAFLIGQRSSPPPQLFDIGLDPQHGELSSDVELLRNQIGTTDSSILLDTTTFASACLALEHGPAAVSLLDLSTVTYAFVLHDQVIVQRNRWGAPEEIPATLRSALKVLRYDRSVISGTLWSANVRAAKLATKQEPNPISDAWRGFLGRNDISLNQSAWDHKQDSPYAWDGVPASYYLDYKAPAIVEEGSSSDEVRSLNDFLSIQTIRTLFNDELASMLGVPYIPTSIRSPVHAVLLSQKVKTQQLADRLLSHVGPPMLEAASATPYIGELSVPFLLGIAFSRMNSASDYWNVIEELRDSFAPLRARISADRGEWAGRSGAYLSDYLKHLKGYMPPGLQATQEAISGASALAAATSPLGGGLVDLAVKMVRALKTTERAYLWYLKNFRPYIHIVVEMATEAKSLRAVENEIERLWGSRWTRNDHDRLERLSVSRPEMFSKLRRLDVPG